MTRKVVSRKQRLLGYSAGYGVLGAGIVLDSPVIISCLAGIYLIRCAQRLRYLMS